MSKFNVGDPVVITSHLGLGLPCPMHGVVLDVSVLPGVRPLYNVVLAHGRAVCFHESDLSLDDTGIPILDEDAGEMDTNVTASVAEEPEPEPDYMAITRNFCR